MIESRPSYRIVPNMATLLGTIPGAVDRVGKFFMLINCKVIPLLIVLGLFFLSCSQKPDNENKIKAIEKGIAWLDKIDTDPFKLRERGLKGKKHFMEKLYAYYQLYKHEKKEVKRKALYKRMTEMLSCTNDPNFHMLPSDGKLFKQDIMTHLHICYLMEEIGLNTSAYRMKLKDSLPRVYSHIKTRNITPQMMFVRLLKNLRLPTTLSLEELVDKSKTAEMRDITSYRIADVKLITYVYDLCHEVFVFTNYGAKKPEILNDRYYKYLQTTIPLLIERILKEGDWRHINAMAELVVCLGYLGEKNVSSFEKGINYILAAQNNDGSFGSFDSLTQYFNERGIQYDMQIKKYLHATEVCLWAIAISMD